MSKQKLVIIGAGMASGRVIEHLVETAPDRVIWGTDWPHVMVEKPMPNDGDLCDLLGEWIGDRAHLRKILVDNPAKLYGFD